MKKNILLFCAFIFLSGCELVFIAVALPIDAAKKKHKENTVIKKINYECLKREGVECLILEAVGNGIAAGKGSLFIASERRVVSFNLKKKKAAILTGSNDGWFHNSKDGYGQKAEFSEFNGIVLIKNKLYLKEHRNSHPRLLDIASGRVSADKTIAPETIPSSFKNIASDGDSLYFIDNTNKRIVKIDVSDGKAFHIPVFDKDRPIYIDSLTKVGDFIYLTAYESGDCLFARLNLKNGKTSFILKRYRIKILFANTTNTIHLVPEKGESLIIVAVKIDESLHFRIFDKTGKMILDKSEGELKNKTIEIEKLKRRLAEANTEYADNMDIELANSVKLITGFPRNKEPVTPEKCMSSKHLVLSTLQYIASDEKNIYFNDACFHIRRFNIKTGKLDLLARKPKFINTIKGMVASGKYLYIVDSFRYANKILVRRVDLKSGQTSYLAGVLKN